MQQELNVELLDYCQESDIRTLAEKYLREHTFHSYDTNFDKIKEHLLLTSNVIFKEDYFNTPYINYIDDITIASHFDSKRVNYLSWILNNDNLKSYYLLKEKLAKEFSRFSKYITIPLNDAKNISYTLIEQLSTIKFKDVSIELSPLNSIKFKFQIDNEVRLVVIKPFQQPVDLGKDEVIFNLYIDDELILSDAKNISDLVNGIKQVEN